jgi:hypothetical protein
VELAAGAAEAAAGGAEQDADRTGASAAPDRLTGGADGQVAEAVVVEVGGWEGRPLGDGRLAGWEQQGRRSEDHGEHQATHRNLQGRGVEGKPSRWRL